MTFHAPTCDNLCILMMGYPGSKQLNSRQDQRILDRLTRKYHPGTKNKKLFLLHMKAEIRCTRNLHQKLQV